MGEYKQGALDFLFKRRSIIQASSVRWGEQL